MELEFWGVRGSAPVSGRNQLKIGGHTPCASLRSSAGDLLIVDAGTGIMRLGERVMGQSGKAAVGVHILFTHFHLDHVIGLPFFAPLYSARAVISFYSPVAPREAERYLSGLQMGRNFPVSFGETASRRCALLSRPFRELPTPFL